MDVDVDVDAVVVYTGSPLHRNEMEKEPAKEKVKTNVFDVVFFGD